jgi:hypothetical protein
MGSGCEEEDMLLLLLHVHNTGASAWPIHGWPSCTAHIPTESLLHQCLQPLQDRKRQAVVFDAKLEDQHGPCSPHLLLSPPGFPAGRHQLWWL